MTPDPLAPYYLLAIDNGSQSTKVTIFDSRGHALVSARRRLRPYDTSVPGHAVHPGDDIWDSIQGACRDVMARFAGDYQARPAVADGDVTQLVSAAVREILDKVFHVDGAAVPGPR